MSDLFEFDTVTVIAGGTTILSRVSVVVPDGGVTMIAGPSGAGKTTLLRLCNRLSVPDGGTVRFRGVDVGGIDPRVLRRRVGMVFQRPAIFPGTVADNLRVARKDADRTEIAAALESAELDPRLAERLAGDLSGGEAQRMCLARTMITAPEVLLMDEPTSALDDAPKQGLERLVRSVADSGCPVIWVTHELAQIRRLADHVVVLIAGRVAGAGQVDEVRRCDDGAGRFLRGAFDER